MPLFLSKFFVVLLVGISLVLPGRTTAQSMAPYAYDIGAPTLTDIYVNPSTGNDTNSGLSAARPLRTVTAAWAKIPGGEALTETGYRIRLARGTYTIDMLPNYWELKRGTAQFPIILEPIDGAGTVVFSSSVNIAHVSFVYFLNFSIIPNPANDPFHCERCDHVLLRGMLLDGNRTRAETPASHEVLKVNQSQHFFLENSTVRGAEDNAVDFVAVQHGHVIGNKIQESGDWCMYAKGGSANLRIESNEISQCGTGGFTAGQGTGFEFMTAPWIHYEAYNIKFINNIIHHTDGAGMGVNGGYNILLAHNTLYYIGRRSHAIEVTFGARSCDGEVATCIENLDLGGWGTIDVEPPEPIPNKNVFIYNNVLLNPNSARSADQHFFIPGQQPTGTESNLPSTVSADDNLRIAGNIIWNGPADLLLGVGDGQGCDTGNANCNAAQLAANNQINVLLPALKNTLLNDLRPTAGGNLSLLSSIAIPDFPGGDEPADIPDGLLSNTISRDLSGSARTASNPPGAYASVVSPIGPPTTEIGLPIPPDESAVNRDPSISRIQVTAQKRRSKTFIDLIVTASDPDRNALTVRSATIMNSRSRKTFTLRLSRGKYRASGLVNYAARRVQIRVTANDRNGGIATRSSTVAIR